MVKKMFLLVPALMLTSCFETPPDKCAKLTAAREVACATDPSNAACKAASLAVVAAGCVVSPPPTTVPTPPVATPTPLPTAEPTPTPVPTPLPTAPPTPPASYLPKPLAPGAIVYLNNKVHGQGLDSTVRVRGDKEFCFLIHGVYDIDCHLEGWPNRALAEMELAKGCPVWEYKQGNDIRDCHQVENDESRMSCDHFGSVEYRDDPITPAFEGKPEQCGLQRDKDGNPKAGFWIVAHGKGRVRACLPSGMGCGPWVEVNH